jgi:bifunctional non-homologous end joining protein LigD
MLALAADAPPEGDHWAYEIKWDGVRAVTYVDAAGIGVRALSRNNNDLTPSFPELQELVTRFGDHTAVLDGELIALGPDGRPTFNAMQQRLHLADPVVVAQRARSVPVTYLVFDLLFVDGRYLLDLSYDERREELAAFEPLASGGGGPVSAVRVAESFRGVSGADVLAAAREGRLEGVVAKDRRSPYRPGRRSGEWQKTKIDRTQEVVIGGWTYGKDGRTGDLGALLVGVPDDEGQLVYAGKVGSGFSAAVRRDLLARFAPLAVATSPFSAPLVGPEAGLARFVEPLLVGEVRYGEWTPDGRMRHPVWRGLRVDKDPGEVRREP